MLNKVFTNVLLSESYTGWCAPGQGEERSRETLHCQRSREDSSLNRNGPQHGQKSPWCPRHFSEVCPEASPENVAWHSQAPSSLLSLLISYISYPNLCFPPCLQENTRCFPIQHLLLPKAIRKSSLHAYLSASRLWICEGCNPSRKISILKSISICQNLFPL